MMVDHYSTLGVAKSATPEQIKKAWRAAQLRWHPDHCKAADAQQLFAEARAAYEVLGDPEARRQYDGDRATAPRRHPGAGLGIGADIRVDVDVPARLTWTGGRARINVRGVVHVLHVPVDARVGMQWRLAGQGEPGCPPGDIVATLRMIEPDPTWRTVGLDLCGRIQVTLAQVYNGDNVEVQGPTGPLRVRLPHRSLTPLRVRGYGRVSGDRLGDLVLELELVWPAPTSELAAALRRAR